jgi:hypothetical protein
MSGQDSYRAGEKVCWYDAWEHPEIPGLAPTFPHHKHVPPNLRDHRVPAPGISFQSPNLDVVLRPSGKIRKNPLCSLRGKSIFQRVYAGA